MANRCPGATPPGPRRETTTWHLTSALPDDRELGEHLHWLLDRVEPHAATIRTLRSAGAALRWFCLLTARPMGNLVWIEADTLARLAAIGGDLVLDVYEDDDDS